MGIIKVENIKVYAYHGCLDEEERIGSHYQVDLKVEADLKQSAQTDDLHDTVDYVLRMDLQSLCFCNPLGKKGDSAY